MHTNKHTNTLACIFTVRNLEVKERQAGRGRGVRALRDHGGCALELRPCAYAQNLDELPRAADLARHLGAPRLRLDVALDAVGLAHLHRAARAVDDLARRCAALDVTLDTHPLGGGTTADTWIPL
jgi:hypothetical protein